MVKVPEDNQSKEGEVDMELRKGLRLAVILLAVHGCSTEMSEPEVIKKVNVYIDSEKYKEAIITLKSFIKSNPDGYEIRILAGDVYLNSGDYWSAEKEYSRALENGAPEARITPKIAQTLFYKGDHDSLLKLATAALDGAGKSEVLTYQGLAHALRRDFSGADARLQDASKYNAESDFVLATMAKVDVLRGNHDRARQLVERTLKTNPQCQYCWSVLGDLEFAESQYAKAVENYAKAVDLGSFYSQDYFKRAISYIYLGNYEKAKADLSRLSNTYGATAETEFAHGLIEYDKKEYQEAAAYFDNSLKLRSDHVLSLFYMALAQHSLENYERAEFFAQKVVAMDKSNVSANSLLASILDKQGRYSEAANQLKSQYRNSPQSMVYYTNLLVRSGRTGEAIAVMHEIAELYPDSAEVMAKLGTLMLSTGDQTGIDKLEAALELDADYYYADTALALNHLQNKDFDQALEGANRIKGSFPELSLPYGISGRTYMAMGDENKALNEFKAGCELMPGDTDTCISYGALLAKQDELDKAEAVYEQVMKIHPNLPQGYLSLSAIHAAEGDFGKFAEVLERGIKHTGDLMPRLVLSRYYLSSNQTNKVFPLFDGIERQHADSVGMYDVLAKANLQAHNYQAAKFNLDKWIALDRISAEARYLMSIAEAGLKNASRAERSLTKSYELDPNYAPTRLALAKTAIVRKNLESAQEHYRFLAKSNPDDGEVLKLKASIEELSGNNAAALETYKSLFSENPTHLNMMLLSQQYWNVGDQTAALKLRESWAEDHKDSVQAQMALADVYTSLDEKSKAIRQYRQVVELDQNHFIALNNLAWLLKDTAPKEALAYSEQAYKINPESLHVLDTMALVLGKNGDYNRAKRTIDRVVDRAPDNLTFKYHRALIDAEAGHKESAKRILAGLVDVDFPEKSAAKALLQTISQ